MLYKKWQKLEMILTQWHSCGISVLGPLLFLIYINDLLKCIKYSRTYHFVDDTNICYDKSLYTLANKVNHDLKNLSQWLKANKLCLNVKKTELVFWQKKKPLDHSVKFKSLSCWITFTLWHPVMGVTDFQQDLSWHMDTGLIIY